MKKIYFLLILCILTLSSCERDFDEQRDSSHRYISFNIDTRTMFDDFLAHTESDFQITPSLDTPKHIRLTMLCYNEENSLIVRKTIPVSSHESATLKIKHLLEDHFYTFVFIADVVDYYLDGTVSESYWDVIATEHRHDSYMINHQPSDNLVLNTIGYKEITLTPRNDTIDITLSPITVNGYVVLKGIDTLDKVEADIIYSESFYLTDFKSRKRREQKYDSIKDKEKQIIGITVPAVQDSIFVLLTTIDFEHGLNNNKSWYIHNKKNRPFVTIIDCISLSVESCVYY